MKTNKRSILSEAIADAKVVKETAYNNAKLAIEEAFSPHVSNMISSKLEQMEMDGDENLDELEMDSNDELDLNEIMEDDSIEEVKDEDEKEEKEDKEDKEEEDEEVDIEDMSEDDLRAFVEDIVKEMAENGEITPTETESEDMDDEVSTDFEDDSTEDEDIDIDELLAEIEGDDLKEYQSENDDYTALARKYCQEHPEDTACKDMVNEAKKSSKKDDKKELNEAYDTIKTLSDDLKEINLVNAKLLYLNKVYKEKDLNESQKVKALESFDKATNIKEVKLVYEAMSTSLRSKSKTSLRESVIRRPASSIIGNTVKPVILESNDQWARWKVIAGLK